jgi:hypothetical protein
MRRYLPEAKVSEYEDLTSGARATRYQNYARTKLLFACGSARGIQFAKGLRFDLQSRNLIRGTNTGEY